MFQRPLYGVKEMRAWMLLQTLYELSEIGEFMGDDGDLEEMEALYFKVSDEEEEPENFRFSGRQKEEIKKWAERNGFSLEE